MAPEPEPDSQSSSGMRVFFDVTIDGESAGRIVFLLYADELPKTCDNFRALCTAERGPCYQGCSFHRIVNGILLQGGDIAAAQSRLDVNCPVEIVPGTGTLNSFGNEPFEDEGFQFKHGEPGVLSMAGRGGPQGTQPNSNGSQFFITTGYYCQDLDDKCVAFGRVLSGMDTVRRIEHTSCTGVQGEMPALEVVIAGCGELAVGESNENQIDPHDPWAGYPEDVPSGMLQRRAATLHQVADAIRQRGNELYQAGEVAPALAKYDKALRYMEDGDDDTIGVLNSVAARQGRVPCWNNRAQCLLQLGKFNEAVIQCSQVLEAVPRNIKALFRRGGAYEGAGQYGAALEDLEQAAHCCTFDDDKMLATITRRRKLVKKREKQARRESGEREKSLLSGILVKPKDDFSHIHD